MTDYLRSPADLSDPEVADTFDDLTFWSSMFGQLLFRHLPLAPGVSALDVGCGTGFPLLELADRLGPTSTVQGIDSWGHAVARARRKARARGNEHVRVVHGDAAKMPFDDRTFDLIVSNLGVNNFEVPTLVMAECHRVCRPGGHLALTTNLVGHMRELYDAFEETLLATGHPQRVERLRRQEAHRATVERLVDLFTGAGFDGVRCRRQTFTLRYADGSAFLRATLTRLGFLDGWRSVLAGVDERPIFEALEARLNERARATEGGLLLTIPAVYLEGRRSG